MALGDTNYLSQAAAPGTFESSPNWLQALFGSAGGFQQIGKFQPDQLEALAQLLQSGLGQIQNPQQGFQPIAQEATRRFEQEGIPSIAERFTSLGQGRTSSPAFASQVGGARAGLESQLAGLSSQYGLQQQELGQKSVALGSQPRFETGYQPRDQGLLEQLLMSLASSAGQAGKSAAKSYFAG